MSIVLAILGHFPVFPGQHLNTSINPRENGNSKSTNSSLFKGIKITAIGGCMFKVADLILFDKGPGGGRSQNGLSSFITKKHPAQYSSRMCNPQN